MCSVHPSARASVEGSPDLGSTSRLSSSDESVVETSVAAEFNPMLSWASFPSKVFTETQILAGDLHSEHRIARTSPRILLLMTVPRSSDSPGCSDPTPSAP